MTPTIPNDVIDFWREAGPARWFAKDAVFDAAFRARFHDAHFEAAARRLDDWAATPDGMLALLLLLDQFPRNAFRGSAHMFATDPLARRFARDALAAGFDAAVEPALRVFFYLPFMHSEDPADQALSVACVERLGGTSVAFAHEHRDIIARFGRFPHRNAVLGRDSSEAEIGFLAAGGFAG